MEVYDYNSVYAAGQETPPPKPRTSARTIVACVLAAIACVLACIALIWAVSAPAESDDAAKATERLYAKVSPSVVQVYDEGKGHAGSGVVYEIRGGYTYILTNRHVVPSGENAFVRFERYAEQITATLLGYDDYHDIALLRVKGSYGVPAKIAERVPAVGREVLAVGNNLGHGIACFTGVVSHTSRLISVADISEDGEKTVPVYAVTCAINSGMSGGGIFDYDGGLIGIGTYQASDFGGNPVQCMNYAVPSSVAAGVARAVLASEAGGQIERCNVTAENFSDESRTSDILFGDLCFSARFTPEGLKVNTVLYPEGQPPFELQGGAPQIGDVVTSIGDLTIARETSYAEIFAECLRYVHAPSMMTSALKVRISRDGQALTLTYAFKHLRA